MKYIDLNYYKHLFVKYIKRNGNGGFIDYIPSGLDVIFEADREEVLGNATPVLREDGQWNGFRPKGEKQCRGDKDKQACVSFAACNALEEILVFYNWLVEMGQATQEQREILDVFSHFGFFVEGEPNISDRYVAKMSGTGTNGNTLKNVADSIRHFGLVPEQDWQYVNNWYEYYKAVPQEIVRKGMSLVEYIEVNYEFASPSLYKSSLKYAPLETSGYAWNGMKNGLYIKTFYTRNHAIVKDGYTSNSIKIFDTYEPFGKETTTDFSFGSDMIFTLHLKKKLNLFRDTEVAKLKTRGMKYILLVEDCGIFTRGLWKITDDNQLIKVEANKVPDNERNDAFIIQSAQNGTLKPYSQKDFKTLIT